MPCRGPAAEEQESRGHRPAAVGIPGACTTFTGISNEAFQCPCELGGSSSFCQHREGTKEPGAKLPAQGHTMWHEGELKHPGLLQMDDLFSWGVGAENWGRPRVLQFRNWRDMEQKGVVGKCGGSSLPASPRAKLLFDGAPSTCMKSWHRNSASTTFTGVQNPSRFLIDLRTSFHL